MEFEFDDGTTDFAEVGDKETAEFYAREQLGETAPNALHPRKNPAVNCPAVILAAAGSAAIGAKAWASASILASILKIRSHSFGVLHEALGHRLNLRLVGVQDAVGALVCVPPNRIALVVWNAFFGYQI